MDLDAYFLPGFDYDLELKKIKEKVCTEPYVLMLNPLSNYCLKDNMHVAKSRTTASCDLLNFAAMKDSFVVQQLGVPRGKVRMDQLGAGSEGTFCHNLRTKEGTPYGGSSSGCIAALKDDLSLDFAIGTDTGGSIRLPVVTTNMCRALTPAWGQISRRGVVPLAQPLDRVAIMARNFRLLRQVYTRLAIPDILEKTCTPRHGLRLPLLDYTFGLEKLERCRTELKIAYERIVSAYLRSSTDRYGIHYTGLRADLTLSAARRSKLGPEIKRRITAEKWTPDLQDFLRNYRCFLYFQDTSWMSTSLKEVYELCNKNVIIVSLNPVAREDALYYHFVNLLNLAAVTFKNGDSWCQVVGPKGCEQYLIDCAQKLDSELCV